MSFKGLKSFMWASPVALLRLTVLKPEWSISTAGPEPAQSSRDDPHSLPQKGICCDTTHVCAKDYKERHVLKICVCSSKYILIAYESLWLETFLLHPRRSIPFNYLLYFTVSLCSSPDKLLKCRNVPIPIFTILDNKLAGNIYSEEVIGHLMCLTICVVGSQPWPAAFRH